MRAKTRLDGQPVLLRLPAQMEKELAAFCAQNNIRNKSECIRRALGAYINSSYQDETLKLTALKSIEREVAQMRDMLNILFTYITNAHMNMLAYHPDMDAQFKETAFESAESRHKKFFEYFKNTLREDAPLFERLLHSYITGELDGQG